MKLNKIKMQRTQNLKQKTRNKTLTPIEMLLASKIDIEEKCRLQEKKLNEDLAYIQDNTASLILSSISTLLFPQKNKTKNAGKQSSHTLPQKSRSTQKASPDIESSTTKSTALSLYDYIAITKNLMPVAWGILQPIIISWGIKKAKSMLIGLFTENK